MTETDTTTTDPTSSVPNAASYPGTPQAAAAEALGEPVDAPVGYVDLTIRRSVNKRRSRGLACMMGADFPGGMIRIRPWSARPIQIFRETYEGRLRQRNPRLKPGDELEPADKIELNRATAVMSITGLEASMIVDGEVVSFTFPEYGDDEAIEEQRRFVARHFLVPFDSDRPETAELLDMEFLQLLMGLNDGLSKVPYLEIHRLGGVLRVWSLRSHRIRRLETVDPETAATIERLRQFTTTSLEERLKDVPPERREAIRRREQEVGGPVDPISGDPVKVDPEHTPIPIEPDMVFWVHLDRELAGARADNGFVVPSEAHAALDRWGIRDPDNREAALRMLDAIAAGRNEAANEEATKRTNNEDEE